MAEDANDTEIPESVVDNTETLPTAPEDAKVTLEGPALSANRFFVHLSSNGVRVAFSERVREDLNYQFRSAVILSYEDAIALKGVLQSLLEPIEAAIAKKKADISAEEDREDG